MNCNNTTSFTLGIFLMLIAVKVYADGWSVFSQHDQMKNHVIADVGVVSKVAPPFNTNWERNVFQINGRCFVLPGYSRYWSHGDRAALLLVNAQKSIQLALIQSEVGSTKIEVLSITMIECPAGSNVIPYSDDPEEQLRLLKKRQEELNKKLEELKRQR